MATWKQVLTKTPLSSDLATEGSSGQVLTTNGSGTLSFTSKTTNTNTVDMGSGFIVVGDSNSNATTIIESETLTIAGGTGITTDTTADGTLTITNSSPNVNTVDMGSGFVMRDSTGTDVTITEDEFFQITVADGASFATAVTGSGTTGAPYVMTITAPFEANTNTNELTTFVLEDGDGSEVTISHDKEVKFIEGGLIDINWTDTSTGSDGDPYDLTFTVDDDLSNYDNSSSGFITSFTNTNTLTTFTLTGDSGTNQTIAHSNTFDIAGGTNINTVVGATDTVTVNLDASISITTLTCSDINVGNLTITGTSTKIETETIELHDNLIHLNSNFTGQPSANLEAGISIERGDEPDTKFYYNEALAGASDAWGMWKLDRGARTGTWSSQTYDHATSAYVGTVSYGTAPPTNPLACFYGQIHVETDTDYIWICTDPYTDNSGGGGS